MDCCYLLGIKLKSGIIHNMSQKGKTLGPKITFVKVQFEINLFEFLKNQSDVT